MPPKMQPQMPPKIKPKMPPKKRTRVDPHLITEMIKKVLEKRISVRRAAKVINISFGYLSKLVRDAKACKSASFNYQPNIGNRKTIPTDHELALVDYLKTYAKMCHGLTTTQVRILAYQYAVHVNCSIPSRWNTKKAATREWLRNFLKRHTSLNVRKLGNTSITGTTNVNQYNVQNFFDNLEQCYAEHDLKPNMIWNLDEIVCATVTDAPEIVAQSDLEKARIINSTEPGGSFVTMLAFVNAAGGHIPPVFIFPRAQFEQQMLQNGPTDALGLANESGTINDECFLQALKHFVSFVGPSAASPALIVLDNEKTQINIDVVLYARENNIIIITFPPHCGDRLKPLDETVSGPLKAKYQSSMNDWKVLNPNNTVTIDNVAEFARHAFNAAFTVDNISTGFNNTGIWPLNKYTFTDTDFLPVFVTGQPESPESSSGSDELHDESGYIEPNQANSDEPKVSISALNDSKRTVSVFNEEIEVSTLNQRQPENFSLNEAQPRFSTFLKSQPGPSFLKKVQVKCPQTDPLHSSPANLSCEVTHFSGSPIGEQRKDKITTLKKDKLLIENITDVVKKEPIETEPVENVEQNLDCGSINQVPKEEENNGKGETKKRKLPKNAKITRKKKIPRKIANSNISNDSASKSNTDSDSTSDNDTKKVSLKFKKRSLAKYITRTDDQCNVCKKKYSRSTEAWYQCIMCATCAHDTCGVKDADGDAITISSDEELTLALNETALEPVNKLHVKIRSDNHSESNATQSNVIHIGVFCDGCNQTVRGFRFKCLQCADYDLCNNCHNQGMHTEHSMLRLSTPHQSGAILKRRFLRHINKFARKHSSQRDEDRDQREEAECEKTCESESKKCGRPRTNRPACPFVPDSGNPILDLLNLFADNGGPLPPRSDLQGEDKSKEADKQSSNEQQSQEKGKNVGEASANNSNEGPRAEPNLFAGLNKHLDLFKIVGQNLHHFLDPLGIDVNVQLKPTEDQKNSSEDKASTENNASNSREKTPAKSDGAATPASNASNSDSGSRKNSTPESFHSLNQKDSGASTSKQNIGFVLDNNNRSDEEWTFVKEVPMPKSGEQSTSSTPQSEAAATNLPTAPPEVASNVSAASAPKSQTTVEPSKPPTTGIYPNLPKEKEIYHPDPKIQKAVETMIEMGFSNKDHQLTNLLVAKGGDILTVLDILQRF